MCLRAQFQRRSNAAPSGYEFTNISHGDLIYTVSISAYNPGIFCSRGLHRFVYPYTYRWASEVLDPFENPMGNCQSADSGYR